MYRKDYQFKEFAIWIVKNGYSVRKFAKASKLSFETIYKLLHGGKITMGVAKKIAKATNNQFPIESLPLVEPWGSLIKLE